MNQKKTMIGLLIITVGAYLSIAQSSPAEMDGFC